MISIRTKEEIEKIKIASKISAQALELAGSLCCEGNNTFEIDKQDKRFILAEGAEPNFLNYAGYPNSCCISVNDMIIHGIPSKKVVLKKGDIVSVDVGAKYEGYNGDNAYTFVVGEVEKDVEDFLNITKKALENAIEKAVEGNRVGDISKAVEDLVVENGYGIVKEFVGHGVGEKLHEPPEIPNFVENKNFKGPRLLAGMVVAIEPMTTKKECGILRCKDGWGIKTNNKELAAHFEHTVLITKEKPIVLTKV